VFKLHLPLKLRQLLHISPVKNIRLCVKDFKNTLCGSQVGNHLIVKIAQVHHRVPEHINISPKCHQHSDADIIPANHPDANPVKNHGANTPAEINGRPKQVCNPGTADKGLFMVFYQPCKNALGFLLCMVALDHLHPRDPLVDICV